MAFNYSPKIVTNNLVLYLDAANSKSIISGSTVWNDISRFGNNGTLTNGPTFSSSNGGSIVFDGVNDYIDCGNKSVLSIGSEGTMGVWIKTSREYPSNTSSYDFKGIVGKVIAGAVGQQSYYMDWYGTNNNRILRVSVGDISSSTSTISVNYNFNNTWKYVVGVWTNSYIQLWSDGVLLSQSSNTILPQVISNTLKIGSVFGSWEGNIGISQLYNRALTSQEIQQNFNATRGRYGI